MVRARLAALAVALTGFLAFAVAGVVVLEADRAAAVQKVSCGDKITADTTLRKDLINCPNNGIVIGADDITLNLNGHTIDGDGTASAGCDTQKEFCDVGVVNEGHDGVTVMHGLLRQSAVAFLSWREALEAAGLQE